jgi:hypothetical protein
VACSHYDLAVAHWSNRRIIRPVRPFKECLAPAGMVLNQAALSKAQWLTEVEKMRDAFKAPIDPKDVDAIVDYLVRRPWTAK